MNENKNYIERLGQLEKELNSYAKAMNNAADAMESTEREIVDILGELVAADPGLMTDPDSNG